MYQWHRDMDGASEGWLDNPILGDIVVGGVMSFVIFRVYFFVLERFPRATAWLAPPAMGYIMYLLANSRFKSATLSLGVVIIFCLVVRESYSTIKSKN